MSAERSGRKPKPQKQGVQVTPTGRIGYQDSRYGYRGYIQPEEVQALRDLRDNKEDEIGANTARGEWAWRKRMLGRSIRLEMVRTANQIRRALNRE